MESRQRPQEPQHDSLLWDTTTTSRRRTTSPARRTSHRIHTTAPIAAVGTACNAVPFWRIHTKEEKEEKETVLWIPNYKKTDQEESNQSPNDDDYDKTKKDQEEYRHKGIPNGSWLLGVGIMVIVMVLGGFQPQGLVAKKEQTDQQGSLATLNQYVPFGSRRQAELPAPLQAMYRQDQKTTTTRRSSNSSSSTNRSKMKDDENETTTTAGGAWFRSDYNLVHVLHTELWSHSPSSKTTRRQRQDQDLPAFASSHALDRARLDLLQTFTIPSLMQQDNQQYLWMIWIVGDKNPAANPELWHELFQSLQRVPQAIVVQVSTSSFNRHGRLPYKTETIRTAYGGGGNSQPQHHHPFSQRPTWTLWRPSTLTNLESLVLVTPKQKDDWAWNPLEPPTTGEMWGDNESSSLVHQANHVEAWSLFLDYVQASQTRVALDTWLEADDALSFDFVETVQAEVAYTYQDSHKDSDAAKQEQDKNGDKDKEENDPVPSSSSSGMQVYCPEFHAEWRYFGASSPPPSHGRRRNQPNVGEAATDSPETNDRNNNKKGRSDYNDNNELGQLVHVHNRRFCIASGLTVAHPLPSPSSPSSLEDDGPDEEQTRGSSKRQRRRLQQRRPRHLSPCNEAQHHDDCQDRDRSSSTIGHVLTMYRGKGKGGKGKGGKGEGGSKKYCDDKNETEKSSKQSKSKSKASTKPNEAKSQKGEDHKSSSLSSLEATKKKKLSLLRASPALFQPQEVQSQSQEDELLSSSTDMFETSSSSASFLWNLFDVSDSKKKKNKKNKKNKKPKQPKDRQLLLAGYHNVTRSIKHKTTNKSSSSKMSKQEPSSCKNKKKEKLSWIPTGTATLMTNRSGPLYYNAANYSATCPRGSYYCRGASSSFHDEDDDPDTWFADKELINHQDLMHATNSSNSSNPGPCAVSVVCRPTRVDTDDCQSEEDDHVVWFNLHLVHPSGTQVYDFDVEYVGTQAFADFVAYMKRQMNGDSCPLRDDDDDDMKVQKKTKTKDKVDAYTITLAYVRSIADHAAQNIPQYAYYEFSVVSSPNKTDKDDQPPKKKKKKKEKSVSLGGAPRIQRFSANGLMELALCVAPVPVPPKKKKKKNDHCVQRLRRLPEMETRSSLGSSTLSSSPKSTANWFGWNTAKPTNAKQTKKDRPHPHHHDSTTGWLSTVQYRPMQASVLLARTPTAAGMKHVLPPPNNNKTAKTTTNSEIWWSTYGDVHSPAQAAAWQHVTETFGVDPERVRALRRRMQGNLRAIVLDNLYRQCAPGHSCKRSTQKALQLLLEQHALQEERLEPKLHDKMVDASANQKDLSNQDDSAVAEPQGILRVLSSLFLFG